MGIFRLFRGLFCFFARMEDQVLRPDEFRCEMCGRIFPKGWSEEEAAAEMARNFNEEPKDDDAILCDDCYKRAVGRLFN